MLGYVFRAASWRVWLIILAGAFGLPMPDADRETFTILTHREPPRKPVRELWVLAGRRGGKTNVAAAIAVFLATLKEWKFSPGETGTIMVLAADRSQARVAFDYCLGLLEGSPVLSGEKEDDTADTIRLTNGIEIVIATSDKAAVRGRTMIAVICDEIAFWGADADEILTAIRPGMASQPQAMLICISTAYSQRGPLYEAYKRFYGTDDPNVLVVRASTRELNESISQDFIDAEMARDPQAAAAEYMAEFRSDLSALLDAQLVDSCTRCDPRELPYRLVFGSGLHITYKAGLDVSGGRSDATSVAIAHKEGDRVIVDALRFWKSPHDPVVVAGEVAEFLKSYKLASATADQYGAEITKSVYAEAGVSLMPSELNRSELYLALQPVFSAGRIEIPAEPRLRTELLGLERRTGRSGKDVVDHRDGQHDDLANAVAVAVWQFTRRIVASGPQVTVFPTSINAGIEGLGGAGFYFDEQRLGSRDVSATLTEFFLAKNH